MKRVMIIGQPGAGKSTLARSLGECIELPVVYIGLIHWKSGWVERDRDEKTKLCLEVHARDEWIFEGGTVVASLEYAFRFPHISLQVRGRGGECLHAESICCWRIILQLKHKIWHR